MVISFPTVCSLPSPCATACSRPRQIRGLEKCDFDRRTGLRFNPCDGGSVLHGLAVSTSDLIRTFGQAADRHPHRAPCGSHIGAIARCFAPAQRDCFRYRSGVAIWVSKCFVVFAALSPAAWLAGRLYSLIGLAVVVGLGVNYANLEPRYRLADQVPDKQQAVAASHLLDAKLTGANPIDVLIEFPKGASLYAPRRSP